MISNEYMFTTCTICILCCCYVGKVFLAYGKLSAEGDEDCSAALPYRPTRHLSNANTNTTATATSHTRHRAGSYTSTSGVEVKEGDLEDDQMATAAPYKPNIVAISLEIGTTIRIYLYYLYIYIPYSYVLYWFSVS